MKTIKAIAFFAALAVSAQAGAATPWLHVRETVTINAPAATVWKAAKDFDALNTWHPAIAKDEIIAGTNDTVGAVRVLTLKDGGGTIKEKLLAFDPAGRKFRYAILESPLPIARYTATFTVVPAGKGKATAAWSARFQSANTGASPADNAKAGVDAITGVFQTGLSNLKKIVEAGSQ